MPHAVDALGQLSLREECSRAPRGEIPHSRPDGGCHPRPQLCSMDVEPSSWAVQHRLSGVAYRPECGGIHCPSGWALRLRRADGLVPDRGGGTGRPPGALPSDELRCSPHVRGLALRSGRPPQPSTRGFSPQPFCTGAADRCDLAESTRAPHDGGVGKHCRVAALSDGQSKVRVGPSEPGSRPTYKLSLNARLGQPDPLAPSVRKSRPQPATDDARCPYEGCTDCQPDAPRETSDVLGPWNVTQKIDDQDGGTRKANCENPPSLLLDRGS